MDGRSWLWRRKSSDKSPGETDSSISGSGSISSPSERFSDEHQASPNHNTQSPKVTSKAAPHDEDTNDCVKILTEKLSAAIATITAEEELVKQHAKVAEEAVTGWEKAEKEVVTLTQQLEAATKKKTQHLKIILGFLFYGGASSRDMTNLWIDNLSVYHDTGGASHPHHTSSYLHTLYYVSYSRLML